MFYNCVGLPSLLWEQILNYSNPVLLAAVIKRCYKCVIHRSVLLNHTEGLLLLFLSLFNLSSSKNHPHCWKQMFCRDAEFGVPISM